MNEHGPLPNGFFLFTIILFFFVFCGCLLGGFLMGLLSSSQRPTAIPPYEYSDAAYIFPRSGAGITTTALSSKGGAGGTGKTVSDTDGEPK